MSNYKEIRLYRVNEDDLYAKLGLKIDEDGNFYDPLEKDLDNDGIVDRYDHDFRDSDYLESTFDIDENDKEVEATEYVGNIVSDVEVEEVEGKMEIQSCKL